MLAIPSGSAPTADAVHAAAIDHSRHFDHGFPGKIANQAIVAHIHRQLLQRLAADDRFHGCKIVPCGICAHRWTGVNW